MDGIYFPIVIKQNTEVINVPLHIVVGPWSMDILACVALESFSVDVGIDIELSVGIPYAWCPNALTINFLMVLEPELVILEVEPVETVADILPIDEVFGM